VREAIVATAEMQARFTRQVGERLAEQNNTVIAELAQEIARLNQRLDRLETFAESIEAAIVSAIDKAVARMRGEEPPPKDEGSSPRRH
jgi:hypothetical protein